MLQAENETLRQALGAAYLLIENLAESTDRALRGIEEVRASIPESQDDHSA